MSCIDVPKVPRPPGLDALLPALSIPIPNPHVGLSLCCEFSVSIFNRTPSPISLIPGGVTIMATAIPLVMQAIDDINGFLDTLSVDCPLE